jgi:hypothetical protein
MALIMSTVRDLVVTVWQKDYITQITERRIVLGGHGGTNCEQLLDQVRACRTCPERSWESCRRDAMPFHRLPPAQLV